MKNKKNITIIGGGVVGLSIAYELSKTVDCEINLIEKNEKIADDNQSTRNSGVIHAGIYYDKKIVPKKAAFCVEGNRLLYEFCKKHNVVHKKVGKFVVATNDNELEYLEDTLKIARENNVPDIRIVDKSFVKRIEPNVNCVAALYCPTSGVIDPVRYIKKLHGLIKKSKTGVYTNNKVMDILPFGDQFKITIQSANHSETFDTDFVINSAGLYSDIIATMVNPENSYEIIPVKGEAVKFLRTENTKLFTSGMNIYPTPHGVYVSKGGKAELSFSEFSELYHKGLIKKTVGVHLTPLVLKDKKSKFQLSDEITIGPALKGNCEREDYEHTYDKNHYVKSIKSFFPNISEDHLDFHQTGIQAILKGNPDFVIEKDPNHENFINLIGIDSPGLTSSLAIGKYVCKIMKTLGMPLFHGSDSSKACVCKKSSGNSALKNIFLPE
jgi:L-2-hydroxyglutarate oxidase LhgO